MGNCCSFDKLNEEKLIKAQSVVRRHFACKIKDQLKVQFVKQIAGKLCPVRDYTAF